MCLDGLLLLVYLRINNACTQTRQTHLLPPHLISFHPIPSRLIPSHLASSHPISSHLISFHPISSHLISPHLISSRSIPSHLIASRSATLLTRDSDNDISKCVWWRRGLACRCDMTLSRFRIVKGGRKRRENMWIFLAKPYGPGLKRRLRYKTHPALPTPVLNPES